MQCKIALLLGLMILIAACGSGNGNPAGSSESITGNWQMSLQPTNTNLNPKTESGFLSQANNVVTGSMILNDTPCSGVGNVSGTVSGTAVSLVVSPTGVVVNLSGTFGSDQTSMSGTYTILSTGCAGPATAPETGTWTANLVKPLSGSIQGYFASNNLGANLPVTGQLTQQTNAGASVASLAGNLSITGYCFTSATVAGSVSGTTVVLNLLDSDGTQIGQVNGTSSTDGTLVTGKYEIVPQGTDGTKPCKGGDSGTVSLTL